MARAQSGEGGGAERSLHRSRRHRLRPSGMLRQPHRDPKHRRSGSQWSALQQHAHDGALLAVALLHHHRPQPPFQPFGLSHKWLDGVSRIRRLHPVREWLPLGDPAAEGLQHLLPRQVAPGPGGDDDGGRPLRPLADGSRVRALLRLPRRRHPSILSGAGSGQFADRAGKNP